MEERYSPYKDRFEKEIEKRYQRKEVESQKHVSVAPSEKRTDGWSPNASSSREEKWRMKIDKSKNEKIDAIANAIIEAEGDKVSPDTLIELFSLRENNQFNNSFIIDLLILMREKIDAKASPEAMKLLFDKVDAEIDFFESHINEVKQDNIIKVQRIRINKLASLLVGLEKKKVPTNLLINFVNKVSDAKILHKVKQILKKRVFGESELTEMIKIISDDEVSDSKEKMRSIIFDILVENQSEETTESLRKFVYEERYSPYRGRFEKEIKELWYQRKAVESKKHVFVPPSEKRIDGSSPNASSSREEKGRMKNPIFDNSFRDWLLFW